MVLISYRDFAHLAILTSNLSLYIAAKLIFLKYNLNHVILLLQNV